MNFPRIDARVDAQFCAAENAGRCPQWLNEGLAQWMEGREAMFRAAASRRVRPTVLHSITSLEGQWSGLSARRGLRVRVVSGGNRIDYCQLRNVRLEAFFEHFGNDSAVSRTARILAHHLLGPGAQHRRLSAAHLHSIVIRVHNRCRLEGERGNYMTLNRNRIFRALFIASMFVHAASTRRAGQSAANFRGLVPVTGACTSQCDSALPNRR